MRGSCNRNHSRLSRPMRKPERRSAPDQPARSGALRPFLVVGDPAFFPELVFERRTNVLVIDVNSPAFRAVLLLRVPDRSTTSTAFHGSIPNLNSGRQKVRSAGNCAGALSKSSCQPGKLYALFVVLVGLSPGACRCVLHCIAEGVGAMTATCNEEPPKGERGARVSVAGRI
jgi:hypothetical protein